MNKQRGYTLLELMLVIGILAGMFVIETQKKQAEFEQARARTLGVELFRYGQATQQWVSRYGGRIAELENNASLPSPGDVEPKVGDKTGVDWLKSASCSEPGLAEEHFLPCEFLETTNGETTLGRMPIKTEILNVDGTLKARTVIGPLKVSDQIRGDLAGLAASVAAGSSMVYDNTGPSGAWRSTDMEVRYCLETNDEGICKDMEDVIVMETVSNATVDTWLRTDGSNPMRNSLTFDDSVPAENRMIIGVSQLLNNGEPIVVGEDLEVSGFIKGLAGMTITGGDLNVDDGNGININDGGSLTVSGSASVTGPLTVDSIADLSGGAVITGDALIVDTDSTTQIKSNSLTSIEGDLVQIKGASTVSMESDFIEVQSSNADINNSGHLNLESGTVMLNTDSLEVATDFLDVSSSSLSIAGEATLDGSLTVANGNIDIVGGQLSSQSVETGGIYSSGDIITMGGLTAAGDILGDNALFSGDLSVSENITASGDASIMGDLSALNIVVEEGILAESLKITGVAEIESLVAGYTKTENLEVEKGAIINGSTNITGSLLNVNSDLVSMDVEGVTDSGVTQRSKLAINEAGIQVATTDAMLGLGNIDIDSSGALNLSGQRTTINGELAGDIKSYLGGFVFKNYLTLGLTAGSSRNVYTEQCSIGGVSYTPELIPLSERSQISITRSNPSYFTVRNASSNNITLGLMSGCKI